ncbi:protease inhibitor SIL-V5 [Streptomyces albus subsp. chlorinus]|uniref:subtilase-type protease inhibitor n=1 Tax=Streptomyces albus TaxID=1888 RepID=UPI00156E4AE7|nr:subtilase-type protease inhibitor [Streptomyces albus]NSC20987.1 protease inhibitor SIL-V5 [Streptomyces albus subsp. chlorinus]
MSTRLFTRRLAGTAAAATAVALPLLAAPAVAAQPATGRPVPERPAPSTLYLTVSGPQQVWGHGARLTCDPNPRGSHPRAAEACAALDRANGDLDALPGDPGLCTMEHAPVTVSARGTHEGRPVTWEKTYPNSCALHRATGPVFDF